MAFKRSAVRSRLSPPKRPETLVSGLFLFQADIFRGRTLFLCLAWAWKEIKRYSNRQALFRISRLKEFILSMTGFYKNHVLHSFYIDMQKEADSHGRPTRSGKNA